MASIFFFFLLIFPSLVISIPYVTTLPLPSPGAEAFVFDRYGDGPYTSISDGRIVKYDRAKAEFVDFGYSAPNRNKTLCDGNNDPTMGYECGRPLGLSYYYKTGEIYIAEAFFGMCVLGPNGGLATQIATHVGERPFVFPDGIKVDQRTGDVYMTDASSVYGYIDIDTIADKADATGSVIKYERKTQKVTKLMTGLSGAAAVEISRDGSFLIISDHVVNRLLKYWLKGPKAHTSELFMILDGRPNKMISTSRGNFWVAVSIMTEPTSTLVALKFNGKGVVLENVTVSPMFSAKILTHVYPYDDRIYLASLYSDVMGVYGRGRVREGERGRIREGVASE